MYMFYIALGALKLGGPRVLIQAVSYAFMLTGWLAGEFPSSRGSCSLITIPPQAVAAV